MTILASDAFTRADENPLASPWATQSGIALGVTLSGNKANGSAGGDRASNYAGITWPDDQYSQAEMTVTGTVGGGSGPGVMTRAAAAAQTFYSFNFDHAASNNAVVFKAVAGVYTNIGNRTQTFTDGAVGRGESQGTSHRIFLSGVQLGATITDAAVASGRAGLRYSSTETSFSMDNWEGGDFAGAVVHSGTSQNFFRVRLRRY